MVLLCVGVHALHTHDTWLHDSHFPVGWVDKVPIGYDVSTVVTILLELRTILLVITRSGPKIPAAGKLKIGFFGIYGFIEPDLKTHC